MMKQYKAFFAISRKIVPFIGLMYWIFFKVIANKYVTAQPIEIMDASIRAVCLSLFLGLCFIFITYLIMPFLPKRFPTMKECEEYTSKFRHLFTQLVKETFKTPTKEVVMITIVLTFLILFTVYNTICLAIMGYENPAFVAVTFLFPFLFFRDPLKRFLFLGLSVVSGFLHVLIGILNM
ncbi:MAG: hypothetical protein LBQ60_07915 [Bacteroidales bacterium]|jgi:hypothetical protein|nr:hypothetical protein [Bacteroidales bacterium]